MSQHNYFLGQSGTLIKFDAHKTPEFKEKRNVDWMLFGTDDEWQNRYPDYLIHLYNSSAKNNTIINEKCQYTIGQGLTYDALGLDTPKKIEVSSYLAKIADNDVFPRSVKDRAIQGGFANEMIYNKKGDKVIPHHVDFSHIRVSKPEWDETEGRYKDPVYYYTKDWDCRKPQDNTDFTEFLPFKWDEAPEKGKRYLYYYKDYRPNLGIYPLPEYLACVPYIAADYEVSNFTYNNVKNGFSAGYLVNFYSGEPDEKAKREISEMYKNTLHGTDNAGKSVLSFNEDKDSGVEVTPINPNGQDDRFINLNNSIRDEIYTGHGVDPVIVGLKGDNGWSNNADEKRTAIEGWQNSYIDTIQGIFEDYFTDILHFNGLSGKVKVVKKQPISQGLSEATLVQILTLDELRDMAGLGKSNVEANPVSEALKTLSPLVQTKILDSMSLEEIRSLISLTTSGIIEKKPIETTETMSQDDQLLRMFEASGLQDDELEVLEVRETPILSTKDAFNKETEFKHQFINQAEINVLKMIIGGSLPSEIRDALKISETDYKIIIDSLGEQGLIEDGEATAKGKKEAKKNEVFVVYKYVKRSDVSGADIMETTRPFCKRMVTLSKIGRSWELDDIERMNNGMNLDVFTSRGGWRTIEGTNRHVPFCRHIWEQRLVRRK
jgi:hypothetical protein